jgi:hypothetical protein
MKTYSHTIRKAVILMTACLFLGGYALRQATGVPTYSRVTQLWPALSLLNLLV